MKQKLKLWGLAVTLTISSTCMFTSCSSDDNNTPTQEQAENNRTAFVQHTRASLKELAENLNFESWNEANTFNIGFNQAVLNNPAFEKTISTAFFQKIQQSITPVEEGSELAQMGFTKCATVDLTDFNYRFTMNADNTAFNMEEADDMEIIVNAVNPKSGQMESGLYKLSLKGGGDEAFRMTVPAIQMDGLVLVVVMPSEFQFAMSDKTGGTWNDSFKGNIHIMVQAPEDTGYAQTGLNNWKVSGSLSSNIISQNTGKAIDQTTLDFSYYINNPMHKGGGDMSWSQNGRKMFDLSFETSNDGTSDNSNPLFAQFDTSSSIIDVLAVLVGGSSLDEARLTLLDDLTTTLSISDMGKALQLAREGASARRHYADQQTIDRYTQQLNELVNAQITCKGVNQTIPLRLITTKFGIDYWTMPAFKFSDEDDYVSFSDLLDAESVQYGINIVDHAAEPIQQTVIILRQLWAYMLDVLGSMER